MADGARHLRGRGPALGRRGRAVRRAAVPVAHVRPLFWRAYRGRHSGGRTRRGDLAGILPRSRTAGRCRQDLSRARDLAREPTRLLRSGRCGESAPPARGEAR